MTATELRQAVPAPGGGPLDHVQLHVVDSLAALDECRRWAGERREVPLCYDTESGGLSPYHHRMRRVQLGDLGHGWSFRPGWTGAAVELLQAYDRGLAAANESYDNRVLAQHAGFRPRWEVTDDVILIGRLADSLKPAALKPRAALEVDPRAMAAEQIMAGAMARQHWTWDTIPDDYTPYDLYAAMDPVLTAHLWLKLQPAKHRFRAAYDLELATARICAGMMDAGMMVDVPFITEKMATIRAYLDQAAPWLAAEHGITSVNSNDQIGEALARAGIPVTITTAGGKPSVAKDTLRGYAAMFPEHAELLQAILWVRKGEKIIGSYLQKFLDLRTAGDVVHYTINTCRARTHRQSVTDPPMQTYDRDEPIIRGAWIPRPGHVFITVDADQIEMRMTADFSGDRQMIADFHYADANGLSFFVLAAGRIFGEDISKKDPRYTRTKNASYGQVYGSGLDRAAITAGVPVEQMRPVYEGFRRTYPGVQRLMKHLIRQGERMGQPYAEAIDGRHLRVSKGYEYAILNTRVQGSAAVVLKQGLARLDAAGYGPYLRLTLHDEYLLEVPAGHADQALADVTRILTDRDSFKVPITWGGSILTERWRKT